MTNHSSRNRKEVTKIGTFTYLQSAIVWLLLISISNRSRLLTSTYIPYIMHEIQLPAFKKIIVLHLDEFTSAYQYYIKYVLLLFYIIIYLGIH